MTRIKEAVTSNDPDTRRWKSTLAASRMAYEAGELHQAETLLARAMELARDLPERSFAVPATEIGSAAVLLAMHQSRDATARLQKIIAALEVLPDNMHRELLAVALRFFAQALADTHDEHTAETVLEKSESILREIGSNARVQLAYTLCDLSSLYLLDGRISEAEKHISEAVTIAGSVLGPEAPEYTRADMIYKLCMPMQADERLEMASDGIRRMQYVFGEKHPQIARALDTYFKLLYQRGDTARIEEAKKQFGVLAESESKAQK